MKICAQSIKVWVFLFSTSLFLLSSCDEKKPADDKGKQRSALKDNKVQSENCGLASIEELKENCDRIPKWLLQAKTANAKVSILSNGAVVWHEGTWNKGTWKNGLWEKGTWKGGTWEYGTWENGLWEKGTWESGFWNGGSWYGGTWNNGTWKNGFWDGGTWKNGFWNGGSWYGQPKGSDFDPRTAN